MGPSGLNRNDPSHRAQTAWGKRRFTETNGDSTMPTVLYSFQAEEEGEVSVREGEIVGLVHPYSESQAQDGWILVRKDNGQMGYVPKDYLSFENRSSDTTANFSSNHQEQLDHPDDHSVSSTISEMAHPRISIQELDASAPAQRQAAPVPESTPPVGPEDSINHAQSYQFQPETRFPPSFSSIGKSQLSTGMRDSSQTLGRKKDANSKLNAIKDSLKMLQSSKPILQDSVSNKSFEPGPNLAASSSTLNGALEKEDFEDLLKKNDEFFNRIFSNQKDTFSAITEMVDNLSKRLSENTQASQNLVQNLNKLDELIDEERRRWKQQNEMMKNEDILSRTRDASSK